MAGLKQLKMVQPMKTSLLTLALVALFSAPLPALAAGNNQPLTIPDFTKGEAIPAKAKHDWNLGPTGLAGGCSATRW